MNWIRKNNILYWLLIFANIYLILASNLREPGSKAVMLASALLIIISIPFILKVLFQKGKVFATNAAIISIFMLSMELLFYFRLAEHPAIRTWTVVSKNIEAVEFLEKQPFVKFKPNSLIRSQGYRGDDFTHEWDTDDYGYKNESKNELKSHVFDFIAIGDSFTEGMGVRVSDTWASKVSAKSDMTIYNAGVQGYSASQMNAMYSELKNKIKHKGIIIGALPTIYEREKTFSSNKMYSSFGTGGIRSIAAIGDLSFSNSFLVGFIRALKSSVGATFNKELNLKSKDISQGLRIYISEIPNLIPSESELESDENWIEYSRQINLLSNAALNAQKRVILIQYPFRYEVYFDVRERGLSNESESQYYIELGLLSGTVPKTVEVLDMYPFIKDRWTKDGIPLYFSKDGHMNEVGNQLVADFLVQYLVE
jgi:hypothetical protein